MPQKIYFWKHFKLVCNHKKYVFQNCCMAGIPIRGFLHDMSKFSPIEFFESAQYYSGERSAIDNCKDANGMSRAWQHHKGRNTHHWEYWIDDISNGGEGHPKALLMPYKDTVELLCDYIGAGKAYEKEKWTPKSQLKWWYKKRTQVLMHPVVYAFVEGALTELTHSNNIKEILNSNSLKIRYDNIVSDYNKGILKVSV